MNHRDDAGLVAAGSVADLVVLDRDPFAGPADEIGAHAVRVHLGRRDCRLRGLRAAFATESARDAAHPLQIPSSAH